MKILIASDLHGSEFYTRALIEEADKRKADKILLLGDFYYHGPRNPLPKGYAPMKVAELLNGNKDKIIAVRGNCDADVDCMISEFPLCKDVQLFVDGKTWFCTHGHGFSFDNLPPLPFGAVFLQGHTHVPVRTEKDGILLLNPGSVSLPKENSANSFLWYDGEFHACTLAE